eukprot:s2742_g10.t1
MVMFDLLLGEAGVLLVSAQHQGLAWFWEIAQALTASTTSSTREVDLLASLLEHIAAIHGRALSVPGGRFGGQSDQLDLLHSCSPQKHPRCDEILEHLQLVSLGSFCGMKLSIQRLGLGTAHLPFDWIRSTQVGVERFLKTGFSDFFCVARKLEIESAALTVHRGEHHSFWHDDVGQAAVRDKLRRRVVRFLELANDFRNQSRDFLFLRSCACTSELHHAEDLYAALAQCFTPGQGNSPRVLLAIIVDGQAQRQGPIRHAALPGLVFFTQEQLSEEETTDSQAYCWAIGAACDAALLECAQGFSVQPGQRVVKSGTELADGGHCGGEWYPPLQFCEAGLHSGYGVSCFEAPGAAHLNLDADVGRDMDDPASERKNMLGAVRMLQGLTCNIQLGTPEHSHPEHGCSFKNSKIDNYYHLNLPKYEHVDHTS